MTYSKRYKPEPKAEPEYDRGVAPAEVPEPEVGVDYFEKPEKKLVSIQERLAELEEESTWPSLPSGYCRWTSRARSHWPEGGDAWNALGISDNMVVICNDTGDIVDIWDRVTKKTYDILGNETGTREEPYTPPKE